MKTLFSLTTCAVALAAASAVAWPARAAEPAAPTRAEVIAPVLADSAKGIAQPGGEGMNDPRESPAPSTPRARADVKREVLEAAARGELVPAGEGRPTDGWTDGLQVRPRFYAGRSGS